MRVTCVVAALAALVMVAADEAKPPPFNKEELEGILRKEHSTRISNVYDKETETQ